MPRIASTVLWVALATLGGCQGPPDLVHTAADSAIPPSPSPIVILMIGDGMGFGQLDTASYVRYGDTDQLRLMNTPFRGELVTGSPTGITDSAAAATAMATGVFTDNGKVAIDRDLVPVETVIEAAHKRGIATGLVTTTALMHATPAGFASHAMSRYEYDVIGEQMATDIRPRVMLGGGRDHLPPDVDGGAWSEAWPGYRIVQDREQLEDIAGGLAVTDQVLGLFADFHVPYLADRDDNTPSLTEMTMAAIDILDESPEGFFLMVEGGRIDHAGHANHRTRIIGETLEFDDTVAAVLDWAAGNDNVTVLITADHETGGLDVVADHGKGVAPDVRWRWGSHTNRRVGVFGVGPGAEVFDRDILDHRWIHAVCLSLLLGEDVLEPEPVIVANGMFDDLTLRDSSLQPSVPQLAAITNLYAATDARGIGIGVEGVFPWSVGSVVVLLDIDYGSGTGVTSLGGALSDEDGAADIVLSNLAWAPTESGLGWDFAVVSVGGDDPTATQSSDNGGVRDLRSSPTDLVHHRVAINYGDATRTRDEPLPIPTGHGFETFVPWTVLDGTLSTSVAITALLLDQNGNLLGQLNARPE